MFDTDLVPNRTMAEMVEVYQAAVAKISEAYEILEQAQKELNIAFGSNPGSRYSVDYPVLPSRGQSSIPDCLKEVEDHIERRAWRHLVNLSGINKILSSKRADELDKKLESGKLDEITYENVIGMIDLLRDQKGEYAKEAVKEVYDFLRPGVYRSQYKTNQANARWKLGKKIILTGMVSPGYGSTPFHSNYYQDQNLVSVDRVFHLLDGKGIPEGYRSPLVDAINTSQDGSGGTVYFKFQAYQNGNLHLEFKRLDLVSKLNQIAGGGTVLPD